jgi:hypothetical protein
MDEPRNVTEAGDSGDMEVKEEGPRSRACPMSYGQGGSYWIPQEPRHLV